MKTKKLLILITCLCLLMTIFSACGKKENTDTSLVGSWSGQIDMTAYVKAQIDATLGDYAQYATLENIYIDIDLDFTKTEISASFHGESFDNLSAALISTYTPVAEKMLEDTATESGISISDILAEAGTDKESFMKQAVNTPIEQVVNDIKSSMQSETSKLPGEYYLEDGHICDEKGNKFPYTLTDSELTINYNNDTINCSIKLQKVFR